MVKITGSEADRITLHKYVSLLSDHIYNALNQVSASSIFDQTYLDLLRRIRASLIGLSVQLPLWPEVYEMKTPIELLLRTTLTDALTLLYLATFDESEQSFVNELSLLDIGVVKYVEAYIDNFELMDDSVTAEDKEVRKEELYKLIPHLRSEESIKKAKSFKEIRSKSNPLLFLGNPNTESGFTKPLTERSMFEQIKAHPVTKDLAYLYIYQGLFSQTHHYAMSNRGYSEWNSGHACLNWFIAVHGLYRVIITAVRLLGATDYTSFQIREEQYELSMYMAD